MERPRKSCRSRKKIVDYATRPGGYVPRPIKVLDAERPRPAKALGAPRGARKGSSGVDLGLAPGGVEGGDEIVEPARLDGAPQAGHQALVMAQVVHRCQLAAQDLVAAVQMAQVGPREAV